MDPLRWIILLVGIGVLIGIYVWHRYSSARPDDDDYPGAPRGGSGTAATMGADEPATAGDPAADELSRELSRLGALIADEHVQPPEAEAVDTGVEAPARGQAERPAAAARPSRDARPPGAGATVQPERVIVIHVMGRRGQRLHGSDLKAALEAEGLRHGAMGIFHRAPDDGAAPLFSVANMVEPGWFDPASMDAMATPGIAFFMALPTPHDPVTCFDEMLAAARRLAATLDAELRDERRSVLSDQTARHLRDELVQLRLRRGQADTDP